MADRDPLESMARSNLCEDCAHGVPLLPEPPEDCPEDWGATHDQPDDGAWPCSASDDQVGSLVRLLKRVREEP